MVFFDRPVPSSAAPRESISAGHGLHPSFSTSRVGAAPCGRPSAPSHGRPHGGAPTTERTIGVHLRSSAVETSSPAGHGLHRSFSPSRVGAAPCGRPSAPSHGRPHGGAPTTERTMGVHLRSSAVETSSPAGHGLHRSFSPSRVGAAPCGRPSAPSHGRPHGSAPTVKPAIGVQLRPSAAQSSSAAGHGLHPSEIRNPPALTQPSPSRRSALLSSGFCVLASGISAGHGLHPSFFESRPAVR
jgi:hypothetical protein